MTAEHPWHELRHSTRRAFLRQGGVGLGALALSQLLGPEAPGQGTIRHVPWRPALHHCGRARAR